MSTSRDKILITGAGGMLGSYTDFGIQTTRDTLNVEDLAQVRVVFAKHKPSVIFHFAAATNLVECEKDPPGTYRANAVGTYNVALAAREVGAKLVYVSTSAVFDGKKEAPYVENDIPNPQNHYGHSKYMGELVVLGMLPDAIVARTCWMFGGGPDKDHKFIANILKQLEKSKIDVIGGKRGSPTYGKDFVETLVDLVEKGERGVFHVGNEGAPTRVDIAREIVKIAGAKTEIVEADAAVFEKQYPGAGARGNESIASTKITLRPWQEALQEYIGTEWKGLIK
ncbi:MAG: dTDP-4-dehydrorhamnose reductase [Parcubacteria group bacterium Gr01-1014_56]|nr:MAG: dTDP-4-dehydrorhamnose reductase [Parcubacteria group bacterium Gr01-1014_56]